MFTLFTPFATAALAAGLFSEPCVGGTLSGSTSHFSQQQYVDSQLDWRSYYLNRISADRVAQSRGKAPMRQLENSRTK